MINTLLLEDRETDSRWEKTALQKLGFNVFLVKDIDEAKVAVARYKNIEVAILDCHIEGHGTSLGLCEHIRTRYPNIKVIYLTEFDDFPTRLKIKAAGAHSVWCKKEFKEDLLANNGAVMSRNIDNLFGSKSNPESPIDAFKYGKFEADITAGVYKVKGKKIELYAKEKKILHWFLRNPNRALNVDIYNNLYSEDDAMTSSSFKTHIKTLKRKLLYSLEFEAVTPVKDFGYYFRPPK
ncbi:MAG: response regulator [Elusimicrobiota bacterium]|nr:response regulator [Elusimicrobiota bacterium]